MRAVGHYLILEEIPEKEKKTQGGLLLNEKTREDIRYRLGKVVSIGDAIHGLSEGETIMYDRAAGHKTDILDGEYKVITIRDVVAII